MKKALLNLGLSALTMAAFAQSPTLSSGTTHSPIRSNAKITAGAALFEQLDSLGPGYSSQNFELANDIYDNQAANDFEVPAGVTWTLDSIFVPGEYYNGTGPSDTAEVYFYDDAAGIPGSQLHYFKIAGVDANTDGDLSIKLPSLLSLPTGKYWISVVARMDYATSGQWAWTGTYQQAGYPSQWRNPGGGFSTPCTSWGALTTCVTATTPDLAFALYGCDGLTSAGTGSTAYACSTDTLLDLYFLLTGASPGGTYTDLAGTGALTGSIFNPNVAGVGYYQFLYTVSQDFCADTAYINVDITPMLFAGQGDTIEACNDIPTVNLWTGLSGYTSTFGLFADIGSTGLLSDSIFNVAGAQDGLYEFWYIIFNSDACGDDTAFIYVNVTTCVGVADGLSNEVQIYPVPVNELMNISTPEAFGLSAIKIIGAQGNTALSFSATGAQNSMDVSSLASGLYIVELTGSNGKAIRRISVQ